jgi:hypothetical protein
MTRFVRALVGASESCTVAEKGNTPASCALTRVPPLIGCSSEAKSAAWSSRETCARGLDGVCSEGPCVATAMLSWRRRWAAIVSALTLPPALAGAATDELTPRLFLSCPAECFADYLRQELSYFDFVRDPHLDSVLTLLIVRQPSGNGGERFSVSLHRAGTDRAAPVAAGTSARLARLRSFVGAPGATQHALRQELLQLVLRTLQSELEGTAHEARFELSLPPRAPQSLEAVTDPWDFWVFAPELRASTEAQSGHYYAELISSLNLWRITEARKLRVSASQVSSVTGFRLEDGSRVKGQNSEWRGRVLYALSLGRHWAVGAVATANNSDYENLDLHLHYAPLVEFNLFPYAESASEQLRVAYQVGPWVNWYQEANQAGLLRELRPYHALSLIADVHQAWGSLQWIGQLNSFLDEPQLSRLSTGATLALRLAEGLAVTLQGQAAFVQDLISIRGRPVTDTELLLDVAQLPTSYTAELELGITYTFGSVHNTIVNPRFGRVDLQDD